MNEGDNENDNQKAHQDPTVVLDAHRGLMAQKATDARRSQSAVRADLDAVREGQASLEKHLFAGPATDWPQAAEKADYLLRLFANTGEGQDPRYKQLIEDALGDIARLSGKAKEPAP
ncbi:hypothetical protein [Dongia sedimenti]|uniref:Uncharacterized protein n=1 Tax=Dongia sedimenti TaxID=3064282 RepID=A0ABU0YSX9_9PROT|nr:hypothetical protein [Rhodospirillaceae bacterium R-7]